jgi:lipid A 4'-phosphatase
VSPAGNRNFTGVFGVSRGWPYSSIALGLLLGIVFAAYPFWDLSVASWFFDQGPPNSRSPSRWNLVRRFANWVPFLIFLPVLFVLMRKLVFPSAPTLIAPSVVVYLVGSFLLGPGLTSNLLLKEIWGRPRPNHVQQFAGTAQFQPWWRPSEACARNCSFVSGEASMAFCGSRPRLSRRRR